MVLNVREVFFVKFWDINYFDRYSCSKFVILWSVLIIGKFISNIKSLLCIFSGKRVIGYSFMTVLIV